MISRTKNSSEDHGRMQPAVEDGKGQRKREDGGGENPEVGHQAQERGDDSPERGVGDADQLGGRPDGDAHQAVH